MDVTNWLREQDLEEYIGSFQENAIDEGVLLELTADDLRDLGVTKVGHRRKLINAIEQLNSATDVGYDQKEKPDTARVAIVPNVPEIIDSTPKESPEAERRHLTVMFVDMVGSTELSTRIDAEDVREVITGFQNTVAGIISRYEGFVARFMGDGVLCYFGWPRANEDDAERAVRAGISIIESVKKSTTPDGTPLSTRVGIASGMVIVGDLIGSGASEEAAVVGETPNLAARLQSLAGPDELLLPEATGRLLNNAFTLESTGLHTLKGIAAPVQAFLVTAEVARESRFDARNTGNMTPLVGRSQELGLIEEGWTQAKSGAGQMILVSGEAGIGKSRIVQAAIDTVKQVAHTRITFQCSPYHAESAFYPIIHQMQYAAGFTGDDVGAERLEKLQALAGVTPDNVPLLATMLGIEPNAGYSVPEMTPVQLRSRTMEALAETLVSQASHKPVLVVFEDLHWIDPTTLEFLDLAIDAIADHRIFMLATARPTFDHSFGGHPGVRQFALNRLGREQVFSIVAKLTEGKPIPQQVLQIILERTDGVPLFVEELTKTILESGVLKDDGNELVLDGPLNAVAIPNTLHDSLMSRLDRLQPIKEVAQTAACIGREFSHHLLSQITRLAEQELSNALDELMTAELIYRRGVPPEARYQFKHALVRDAAYESLLKPRRRAVHTDVLTALEANPDTSPEVLATHAEAAGLTERAIDLWESASKAAIARPAFDEGIAHLNRALGLVMPQVDGEDSAVADQFEKRAVNQTANRAVALQLQLAVATMTRRGLGAVATKNAFEKAMELVDIVGETPMRFSIMYGLMLVRYLRGDNDEAVRYGEPFVELAEQESDTAPAVVANRSFGVALMNVGQLQRSLQYFERALELFDPEIHAGLAKQYAQDLGMASHGLISFNLLLQGQSQRAELLYRECERYGATCGDINSTCYAHFVGLYLAVLARNESELQRHTNELRRLSEEQNLFFYKYTSAIGEELLRAARGEEAAIQAYRHADDAIVATGSMMTLPQFRIEASRRALALGRRDRADQMIESARAQIASTAENTALSDLYRLEATLAVSDGKPDLAEHHLQHALDVAREQGAKLYELRAAVDFARLKLDQNQGNSALLVLRPAYNKIEEGDCPVERAEALQIFDEITG